MDQETHTPVTTTTGLDSPVVLDGVVNDEKLAELLALQTEYPELDFKQALDLASTEDVVELAKDFGAMQVRGGYIVVGVDGHGTPTGSLDHMDARPFDEANLAPKLLRYLPEPLELRTRVLKRGDHAVALLYVGPHPSGCAFFRAVGQYQKNGKTVVAFRAGDVFWRDGTRSTALSQQGFEEIVASRILVAKQDWLAEQREIRSRDLAELQQSYASRQRSEAPLGAVSFDLSTPDLNVSVLELLRAKDKIALRHLLDDGIARARAAISRQEIESELGDVVDKLACLAATFLTYDEEGWFDEVVRAMAQVYSMPMVPGEPGRTTVGGTQAARVWLLVIERIFAVGALAVRRHDWNAVRTLTLQVPTGMPDFWANWLRHALTMASRANHLEEQQDGRTVKLSLLSLARNVAMQLECLRPDGVDEDTFLTDLAQFDVLSNITAVGSVESRGGGVFYPNFARVYQHRVDPIVERLLTNREMRAVLFPRSDTELAAALSEIGQTASQEGWRYDGFDGWSETARIGAFIADHSPAPEA